MEVIIAAIITMALLSAFVLGYLIGEDNGLARRD